MGWNVVGRVKERFTGQAEPVKPAPLPPAQPVLESPAPCDALSLNAVRDAAQAACRTPADKKQIRLAFETAPTGALGPAVANAFTRAHKAGMSYQGYTVAVQAGLGQVGGLVAATGAAALHGCRGSDEDRCDVAHAFVRQLGKPPLEGIASAFAAASDAGMTWATYRSAVDAAFTLLESQPETAEYARLSGSAVRAGGDDGGKLGRQAMRQLDRSGTLGQRAAATLIDTANGGMDWANFRAASLAMFRELEQLPGAPEDERDLATVARACLEACRGGQDGVKVAWSFLEELKSGQADPGARRLARILLAASDRGMSWSGYAAALQAGLAVLEADGPEAVLLEAGRKGIAECSDEVDRGKVGRALMRQLKDPLTERPEVALSKMAQAASDEGMSWSGYAAVTRCVLEAVEPTPYVELALAAGRAGTNDQERGKLGRAFLRELSGQDGTGKSLARAYRLAAKDGLSWAGYEAALEAGIQKLRDAGTDLGPTPSGDVQARCNARLAALERVEKLTGIREEVEKLVSNPESAGIEADENKVLVGGVRIKVRR